MTENQKGGACCTHGKKTNAYRISVGKHEGKTDLEAGCRREGKIKIVSKEQNGKVLSEFIWLQLQTNGRLLFAWCHVSVSDLDTGLLSTGGPSVVVLRLWATFACVL